jgi:oxygen-independent coproporphyrinogen-3 oxidase
MLGSGTEFTVEANPETVDAGLLADLAAAGVTRLSLGVQSFSPTLLGNLGRRTPPGAAAAAVQAVHEVGWREWSLDLVFGIPGQHAAALAADLEAAISAGPPHISVYDLTYTAAFARSLEQRLGAGERARAEEFAESAYAGVSEVLAAAGYVRYEVSNYALLGHESRHNLAYWRGRDYVGIGASAVGTVGMMRRTNPMGVAAYLGGGQPDVEVLTPELRRLERVMLGLRTAEGVSEEEAEGVVHASEVERLAVLGLVEKRCATLRLSPRGLDLGNAVLAAVLRSPDEIFPVPGRSHNSVPRV